jgi:hypothetical protein
MEAKKVIVSQLIQTVRVSRDYQLDIELSVTCEQLEFAPNENVAKAEKYRLKS